MFLSPSAFIQLANANRDLLILAPSISLIPLFSVTVPLYDPAKSINDNLPIIVSTVVFLVLETLFNIIWKTAWDREEVWLAFVASVVLLLFPINNKFITCYVDSALNYVTPAITTPFYGSSLSYKYPEAGTNKSRII